MTCLLVGVALVAASLIRGGSDDGASATTSTSLVVAVTAPDLGAGTTAPVGSGGIGDGVGPDVGGRTPLAGFGEVLVKVTAPDGRVCQLCLLSALDPEQRERGLMEVTDEDLGGYDGMLFEYQAEQSGAFWMRNTPMPLSIAFFDGDGVLVSTADMEPCGDSPDCPTYPATGSFEYAIEVPQGQLDEIGVEPGSRLHLYARRCPLAGGGT